MRLLVSVLLGVVVLATYGCASTSAGAVVCAAKPNRVCALVRDCPGSDRKDPLRLQPGTGLHPGRGPHRQEVRRRLDGVAH